MPISMVLLHGPRSLWEYLLGNIMMEIFLTAQDSRKCIKIFS